MYQARQMDMARALKRYRAPQGYRFHASGLARCKTQQYYRLAGFIPSMEPVRMSGYSVDGDMHHDQVRHMLKEARVKVSGVTFRSNGSVVENETFVLPVKYKDATYEISMRLDGFITISQRKYVLEIKSLGFWKYKPLAEVWEKTQSEAALIGYLMAHRKDIMYQTHACMLASKLSRTYLLIKDRDSCTVGLHAGANIIGGPIINFDKNVWEEACQRQATVVRHLNLGSPPPPEFLSSSNECKLCRYRHLCHDAEKRRKQGIHPATVHPQFGEKLHVKDK